MRKLRLLCLLVAVGWVSTAQAQFGYFNDALLFSQTSFGGTARIQALGGAQIALGGDVSVAGSNPAGLGFFNRSTFTITPSLNFHNANASYFGNNSSEFKTNFNFSQLGVVLNYSKGDIVPDKFKGGSLAISLNRTNDFHGDVYYEGRNNSSSIVDSYLSSIGNPAPEDLPGLAYDAWANFLIDEADFSTDTDFILDEVNGRTFISPNIEDGTVEGYSSLFGYFGGSFPYQQQRRQTSGGQYRINIAYGGNYDDILYFGGGLGIQTINYNVTRTYTESDFQLSDGTPDDLLNYINIQDNLFVNGSGVNLNLGLTFRPVNFMTVGLAYATPTFYALNEENDYTFETQWNDNISYVGLDGNTTDLGLSTFESDIFISNYSIRTPGRASAGVAVFLGKNGFITGDIEYLDYSNASISSNDFSASEDNEAINTLYQSVFNYRFGAEGRLGSFRVRAGYAYMADPFVNNDLRDRTRQSLTGGLGYRNQDFFIDMAVIYSEFNEYRTPYEISYDTMSNPSLPSTPEAEILRTTVNAMVTLGFIF